MRSQAEELVGPDIRISQQASVDVEVERGCEKDGGAQARCSAQTFQFTRADDVLVPATPRGSFFESRTVTVFPVTVTLGCILRTQQAHSHMYSVLRSSLPAILPRSISKRNNFPSW